MTPMLLAMLGATAPMQVPANDNLPPDQRRGYLPFVTPSLNSNLAYFQMTRGYSVGVENPIPEINITNTWDTRAWISQFYITPTVNNPTPQSVTVAYKVERQLGAGIGILAHEVDDWYTELDRDWWNMAGLGALVNVRQWLGDAITQMELIRVGTERESLPALTIQWRPFGEEQVWAELISRKSIIIPVFFENGKYVARCYTKSIVDARGNVDCLVKFSGEGGRESYSGGTSSVRARILMWSPSNTPPRSWAIP